MKQAFMIPMLFLLLISSSTLATDLTIYSRTVTVTVTGPPSATTRPATDISTTSAGLNGLVNPNGLWTTVEFEWGLNLTLGNTITADQSPVDGTEDIAVFAFLSSLLDDTTYYYRLRAENNEGTTWGEADSFKTKAIGSPPSVITFNATGVSTTSAILNGLVNPNGLETTVWFEFNDLSTFVAEESPVSGTVDQTVSAVVFGLAEDSEYQYRVKGSNAAGETSGIWVNFYTKRSGPGIAAATLTPDNITFNSATLRGTVNPDNVNTTVLFEWGPNQAYGNVITADQSPAIGDTVVLVTTNIRSLLEFTEYHYRVLATSDTDTTFGLNQTFTTLYGPVILQDPDDGSTDMTIEGTLNWNTKSGASTYRLQVATDTTFTNLIINEVVNDTTYDVLLTFGNTYYWRVAMLESGILHTWSDVWSLTTETFPTEITVDTTLTFQSKTNKSDFLPTDYQLFGLPGDADTSLSDVLGSGSGDRWIAYWDNGRSGNPETYLQAYSNNAVFRFRTGRAFWILYNGTRQINLTVTNTTVNADNEIAIPLLHIGWNLITNPLRSPIDWNIVQIYNGISEPIHSFDGAFSTTDMMVPYKGYYFFNDSSLAMKNIMIPVRSSMSKLAKPLNKSAQLQWFVGVELQIGEITDTSLRLGVSQIAAPGRDILDYHKPRAISKIPGAYFERPLWDEQYPVFASDIRPPVDELEIWSFKVNTGGRENLQLKLSDIEQIPKELTVYLIDQTRQKYINLRKNNLYNFTAIPDVSSFKLVIGVESAVSGELENILPREFYVGASFPNPFNPVTTIPVSVPETSKLSITVFDILGRTVKQVYRGNVEPGKHFFTWNGTDEKGQRLASGIYIYRITNNRNMVFSGKLVLLK